MNDASTAPPPIQRFWIGLIILLCLCLLSVLLLERKPGKLSPVGGDSPHYLVAAYHVFHHHSFTQEATDAPSPPAIGREPGYGLFLAALMGMDSDFQRFTPACLTVADHCGDETYRVVGVANLLLIQSSGIVLFFAALLVCRAIWPALFAAAYLLFNFQMNNGWVDPASDRLAVFLVCLVLLLGIWARQSRNPGYWAPVGLALGALTLTKAAFLVYSSGLFLLVLLAAALGRHFRGRIMVTLAVVLVAYGAVVGGWAARNWSISGDVRLTDTRGGIALSTREVFDHMTPAQYLAAFVYWTRGPGNGLARRWFPPKIVEPFDLDRPGGFYDRGQNSYPARLAQIMKAEDLDLYHAAAILDRRIEHAILDRPLAYLLSCFPLLYRGIWIDEFIVVGLPLFFWAAIHAGRRREWLWLLILSLSVFNLLFYAMFSLNIPRYQMTAVPGFALAAAFALHRYFCDFRKL